MAKIMIQGYVPIDPDKYNREDARKEISNTSFLLRRLGFLNIYLNQDRWMIDLIPYNPLSWLLLLWLRSIGYAWHECFAYRERGVMFYKDAPMEKRKYTGGTCEVMDEESLLDLLKDTTKTNL